MAAKKDYLKMFVDYCKENGFGYYVNADGTLYEATLENCDTGYSFLFRGEPFGTKEAFVRLVEGSLEGWGLGDTPTYALEAELKSREK